MRGILGLLFLYCINAISPFKPFEFLLQRSLPLEIGEYEPKLKIQALTGQGLGLSDSHPYSQSNAFHVIVTVMGNDPTSKKSISIPNVPIAVKTMKKVPCIIEQGNGDFEECHLENGQEFLTNLGFVWQFSNSVSRTFLF